MYRKEAAGRERWKNEPSTKTRLFGPPLTQEERDALDARLHRGHNELTRRMFGLQEPEPEPEPGNTAHTPVSESGGVSQPRAATPRQTKDISRKTRGGRITKSTAQIQSVTNRGTRSRRAVPAPSEGPMPNRQSKQLRRAPDEPDDSPAQAPRMIRKRQAKVYKERASEAVEDIDGQVLQSKPHNTRQRKVYKLERESRRLAGHLPEYDMLPKRGEPAPPYNPSLRHPSNTRKPNPLGPRGRASSKMKSIATKGAKTQGISKSGREETNRSMRSKKQLEG